MRTYIQEAMKHAEYEVLDGINAYFGYIPGFKGVYVYANSFSICRNELADILKAWVNLRMAKGLPLPKVRTGFRTAA